MRLKEIKPGMVIHCNTQEEIKAISDAGFTGFLGEDITGYMKPECYVIIRGRKTADWTNDFQIAADYGIIIEFSDLILPEFTAEEVFTIMSEIHKESYKKHNGCIGCPISVVAQNCDTDCFAENADKIIEICEQWKADHEKKEPEIETVDICRIIEIQTDGRKRCVHEEDIHTELPFGGDERQKVEEILKHYCMEHDGEFIAVHEVVSRVKR